jgi:Eukaryotic cytochrome b561
MTGYHSLVRAHGILAAITFLGLAPAAIMLARFHGRSPFWALRLHIWLQILTLILTTVLFILGFFAVGPERSLSNPHHGIGVAIYVLIIVQVFGGWRVHKKEKGKRRLHIPLKLMLHQWFGRMIALLGIVQIPLGLTLYGSPQYLFILYTLAAFALLVAYFVLSWLHQRRLNRDYDAGGSYLSGHGQVIDDRRGDRRSRLGKLAVAGLGAAGLAALSRRRSAGSRRNDDDEVVGTESGTSYMTNEKYSDTSRSGWKSKLLTIGAVAGAIAAVKALWGRKRDDSSDTGPYRPPLGGSQSVNSESYMEEGHPHRPVTPTGASPGYIRPSHPLAQPPMTPHHRPSNSSLTYSSYSSGSPSRRDRRHNIRDAAATGGALFALRQMFKSRRQRKEDRRLEEERLHRANHSQYTGDGSPPRRHRPRRVGSQSSTDFSGSIIDDRHHRPSGHNRGHVPGGVGAASAAALADRNRIRPPGTDPPVMAGPSAVPTDVLPIPPTHRADVDSSGSEVYTTASGHPHHRHHLRDEAAAGRAGIDGAAGSRRRHSSRTHNTDSIESPPVSLKVKMHNDGRHVTLRRLTEEEAAAQREEQSRANRASVPAASAPGAGAAGIANSGRRRRNSSFSSSSGGEGAAAGRLPNADRRWRRMEALERQQAEAMAAQNTAPPPANPAPYRPSPTPAHPQTTTDPRTGQPLNFPPPPPIPAGSALGPPGSVTSPGTETSGATEYANNRRRRRAERAQARQAREGRFGTGGQGVEFS